MIKKTFFLILGLYLTQSTLYAQEETPPTPVPPVVAQDALSFYNSGNYATAIRITQEEIRKNPFNMDSYAVLSWSLIAAGRFEEAERFLREALEKSPDDARLIEALGEAYFFQERWQEAYSYFNRYIKSYPQAARIPKVYRLLGDLFHAQKHLLKAEMAYTKAVQLSPTNLESWTKLAQIRQQLNFIPQAQEALREALELSPTNRELLLLQDQLSGI